MTWAVRAGGRRMARPSREAPMSHKSSPLPGILMALASFGFYATHDVAVKLLGGRYSVFQVVFFGVLLSFPLVVLMLLRDEEAGTLKPRRLGWSLVRTVAVVISGGGAFYAFSVLPLAQVYSIIFATPLVVTILSIPILGERVGLHRWAAVVVGLIGVLVVLRPDGVALGLGHLAALATALAGAVNAVVVRKIGREERAAVLLIYPMMANFLLMGCVLPFVYTPIALPDLGLWALLAFFAFLGGLALIQAYRLADAVLVAPMHYSQILWAAVYGWAFFDERIDGQTALGAGIIIASGLYIVFREGRGSSQKTPVLDARTRVGTPPVPRIGRRLEEEARSVPAYRAHDIG